MYQSGAVYLVDMILPKILRITTISIVSTCDINARNENSNKQMWIAYCQAEWLILRGFFDIRYSDLVLLGILWMERWHVSQRYHFVCIINNKHWTLEENKNEKRIADRFLDYRLIDSVIRIFNRNQFGLYQFSRIYTPH